MATAYRRKYQFKDRQTAEEEYRKASRECIDQLRLARALYSDGVQWGKTRKPYRFGVFDTHTPCGPKVVYVFHPEVNSEPDIRVVDPWGDTLSLMEQNASYYNNDAESNALIACIAEIREMIRPYMA